MVNTNRSYTLISYFLHQPHISSDLPNLYNKDDTKIKAF